MTAVPKGATVPADHKKPAAQLEAEKTETTDVTWRGHTFTVITDPDDYPVEACIAFEAARNLAGLQILLGPKQWAEFMATKPLKRDGADLIATLEEALGLGN